MIDELSFHGLVTLTLTCIAVLLFARERLPLETSAFGVLVVLVAFFELFPLRANGSEFSAIELFAGFGHEALISICALMVLGRGLERTGALQPLANAMARVWPAHPRAALLLTLLIGALLSAFVNNTPIVVLLLPMLVAVCLKNDRLPSGVLMPMGLATIVGGMATTIGTSTNLLVVTLAEDLELKTFGMFDFALPVVIAGSVGIAYLWLVAPRLIPDRSPPLQDTSPRIFTGRIRLDESSLAADGTIAEALALTNGRMRIDRIQRGSDITLMRLPSVTLKPGDELVVSDTPENLKAFEQELQGTLVGAPIADADNESDADREKLAEITVMSDSRLHGRSLEDMSFEKRFSLKPVALHQPTRDAISADIGRRQLRAGDVILVQGPQERIDALKRTGELLVLDGVIELPVRKNARISLAIMGIVVAVAALGLAPISVSAVGGVLAMLLTRCLTWTEVTEALSVPVILIIVTSLALGTALIETGGAHYLADRFVAVSTGLPTIAVLAATMALLAVLTNVVSNNAAAVIGTPIVADVANSLGAPVEPFLLAVIFGANMSFATPIGYKTNLLVMSAGGYRFSDFLRVGIPLAVIMWMLLTAILGYMYEL